MRREVPTADVGGHRRGASSERVGVGGQIRGPNAMARARSMILDQLAVSWSLLEYHLRDLTDEECLWRPARRGLHLRRQAGRWIPDWPDRESYDLGPPSIGWVTWHIGFWWSMTLNHSFGDGSLRREEVGWPGSAGRVRARLHGLHAEWVDSVASLPGEDFESHRRSRWPFSSKPFREVCLWLNLELMKNAAELGYGRFLYAVRDAE